MYHEGSACPKALTDGEMGPNGQLKFSDAEDIVTTREWEEFAEGREEFDPERLKTRAEDAGAEPEDERAEYGLRCERIECKDPRSETKGFP
jgi:hypothetical protein